MENISRALIIAGGMLLAVLILTLLVFLFNRISIIPQEQTQQYSETGIIEYNRSFEVYQKPLMYGTDIISIINKAVDHNMRNGLLHAGSNFFSKSFVNSIYGELMSIEAKFLSSEDELEFFTRVRIYYNERDSRDGTFREKEYRIGERIKGHEGHKIRDVLREKSYETLLNTSGIKLTDKDFKSFEYPYDFNTYGKDFIDRKAGQIHLIAGDPDQDVKSNKALMKFLEAEPITILNPDAKDKSWSRMVITPASAKLKRIIFRAIIDKTEYYQNGRIKKMYFEEMGQQWKTPQQH